MKKTTNLTVLCLAFLVLASACGGGIESAAEARSPNSTPIPFTTASGIEYSSSHELDVYAPAEAGPWPVVIVAHGLGQSRSQFASLAEAIASEGAVVFNLSVTFSVPPLDGIEGIACGIRFARATASEYGGDPSSISLVGNSSGAAKGSIVAMDGDAYEGDCVVNDGSALPDVFVGYEGPYDYATHLYGGFNVPPLKEEDPEMWEAVNPYLHIGGNRDLVIRLIHGRDNDTAWYDVLPDVSADFREALAEAGYDVRLSYVDGAGHGSLRPGTEVFDLAISQLLGAIRS